MCELEIPEHVDRLSDAFRAIRERMMTKFQCQSNRVLQRILERRRAENPRVVFSRHLSDDDHSVVIAEAEFSKVVEALLDWGAGQGEGELSFEVRTSQDWWMLEMRHNGLFIPSDRWRGAFTADAVPGGVTLSAVPEILAKYDGDICIKASDEDSGTTLLVRLRILRS